MKTILALLFMVGVARAATVCDIPRPDDGATGEITVEFFDQAGDPVAADSATYTFWLEDRTAGLGPTTVASPGESVSFVVPGPLNAARKGGDVVEKCVTAQWLWGSGAFRGTAECCYLVMGQHFPVATPTP